jgi:hypothetical protein
MDVVLIALSLGALAENASGVMVVRLIRVMRVNGRDLNFTCLANSRLSDDGVGCSDLRKAAISESIDHGSHIMHCPDAERLHHGHDFHCDM